MRILTILILVLFTTSSCDRNEGLEETRRLAEAGNSGSQLMLGWYYDNGLGVAEDDAEARKWWRKAAEAGNARGQKRLGYMYEEGHGVSKNYRHAYMWYSIATSHPGDIGAELPLEFLEKKMTPDDISAAQQMAARCLESNYKDCN